MAKKKTTTKAVSVQEGEIAELYYNQYVTIQDNHGTIIFKQTGKPTPPVPPPH